MALDENTLLEVFSWLPATNLHQFQTVAEPISGFLKETYFIEKQCLHSLLRPEESVFVDADYGLNRKADNLLFQALPDNQSASVGLASQALDFLATKGRILASSNGLLLCRVVDNSKPNELFLYNPATLSCSPIEVPTKASSKYDEELNVVMVSGSGNFGSNKFSRDYSILFFENDTSKEWSNKFKVYMFEGSDWVLKTDDFDTECRSLDLRHSVQCNNNLYFMSDCGLYISPKSSSYWPYIICYDIKQATTKKIALPQEACQDFNYCNMQIFGWDACEDGKSSFTSVSLIKSMNCIFSIWIFDNGKDPSWYKLLDMDLVNDLGIRDYYYFRISSIITDKKLVFATNTCIYCFDLKGKGLQQICENTCGESTVRLITYCSTLRPLLGQEQVVSP